MTEQNTSGNNRRGKERTRTHFYNNPIRVGLFDSKKSGSLSMSIHDLQEHPKTAYSDGHKHEPVIKPVVIIIIHTCPYHMNTRPPTWSEVENTVKQAKSASAPGPNGFSE